jgi:hypothetical protein
MEHELQYEGNLRQRYFFRDHFEVEQYLDCLKMNG